MIIKSFTISLKRHELVLDVHMCKSISHVFSVGTLDFFSLVIWTVAPVQKSVDTLVYSDTKIAVTYCKYSNNPNQFSTVPPHGDLLQGPL